MRPRRRIFDKVSLSQYNMSDLDSRTTCFNNKEKDTFWRNEVNTHKNIQLPTHIHTRTHIKISGINKTL